MKLSKSLLALILSTALAFGLGLPAMAEENGTSRLPDAKVFVVWPGWETVSYGESFTLSTRVDTPQEVEALSYQWYCTPRTFSALSPIQGATEPTLSVSFGEPHYPLPGTEQDAWFIFICKVTFVERNTGGEEIGTAVVQSNSFEVHMDTTWGHYKWGQHTDVPFGDGFTLNSQGDIPAWVDVSYEWWYTHDLSDPANAKWTKIEGAHGPSISVAPGDAHYPPQPGKPYDKTVGYYDCRAAFVMHDQQGNEAGTSSSSRLISVSVAPEREMNFFEKAFQSILSALWTPFALLLTAFAMPGPGWIVLAVIGAPITWLRNLFQ